MNSTIRFNLEEHYIEHFSEYLEKTYKTIDLIKFKELLSKKVPNVEKDLLEKEENLKCYFAMLTLIDFLNQQFQL